MKTIKVQGKGTVAAPPDMVIMSFGIEAKSREYANCLRDLNARTEHLRQGITSSAGKQADLRTTDYRVRTNTDYIEKRHVFIGYVASHNLQIELPVDTALLNRVLSEIAKGHSGAEIGLTFTVKDKDALRKCALADAVHKAKANASVLAEAAGVKLGALQQIDYGWAEIRIHEHAANTICESNEGPSEYAANIDPEDVTANDTVNLVYAIEDAVVSE